MSHGVLYETGCGKYLRFEGTGTTRYYSSKDHGTPIKKSVYDDKEKLRELLKQYSADRYIDTIKFHKL